MHALPWLGGKSEAGPSGSGRWIASLLPPVEPRQTYIEPFAGMLGVLLQRAPADAEIVSDLDGRVINFWRVLRRRPGTFARQLALTPNSRAEYQAAIDRLYACPDRMGVQAACDLVVIIGQSIGRLSAKRGNGWRAAMGLANKKGYWLGGLDGRVADLALRVQHVALESLDACELMDRAPIRDNPDAVVYCDPPYANTEEYAARVDRAALLDALLAQRGRVLISGRNGEWDALLAHGWRREEREIANLQASAGLTAKRVTEQAWANYPREQSASAQATLL